MTDNVLVLAAHPDDEILGCGGVMALHALKGDSVKVIFLADGEGSRDANVSANKIKTRQHQALKAMSLLNISDIHFLELPDNRLDGLMLLDVIQKVEVLLANYATDILYTHHDGDLNVDHRIAYQTALTIFRPTPGASLKKFYSFEVLSSTAWGCNIGTHFIPNTFVDISSVIEAKLSAMKYYTDELKVHPHARSVESIEILAKYRGSSVGIDVAEAFICHRSIIDPVKL